ncbi:50S ribosomal protein L25 [Candidatus Saccharibacteria bacterium]|nr:50S ribosomal protein L25 [Candidatus Saccharibacteria bacterium]
MSNDTIGVELKKRDTIGKGLTKLRTTGQVPAVVHNHGKESMHVSGDFLKLTKVYAQAGKHHPVELSLDGKQHLALIKDVDFDPRKHQIRHVVFQAIKQNEKTTAEVPVVLVGEEIPAEKKSLLVLTQIDSVKVEALPRDLPDELTVDATKLEEVGDHLYVSDIQAPSGVTILSDPEASVAVVEMPKDQIAEADAAAAALAEGQEVPSEVDESKTEASSEESSDK